MEIANTYPLYLNMHYEHIKEVKSVKPSVSPPLLFGETTTP